MKRTQLKLNAVCKKYGPAAATLALGILASPAFAAGEEYDNSSALGWIAAGVVSGIALIGAMIGLVAMIGGGKKVQRAGT